MLVELERANRQTRLPVLAIVLAGGSAGAVLFAAGAVTFKLLLAKFC